jgi:MYXO-CTERM domain-containing protein
VGTGCLTGEVTDTEWVGNGGVCQGDSGGPALDEHGMVAGVTSRGDFECELSIYGATWSWADWLKDTVVAASGAGLYEPPGWTEGSTVDPTFSMPVGDDCSSGADCPTGICIESYCSRPCDEAHPCPDDWACGDRNGGQVCVLPPPPGAPLYERPPKGDGCSFERHDARKRNSLGGWLVLAALVLVRRRRR